MNYRGNGTTTPKVGQACWYRGEPGVVIGGTTQRATIRTLDGKQRIVLWSNIQRRNKCYIPNARS